MTFPGQPPSGNAGQRRASKWPPFRRGEALTRAFRNLRQMEREILITRGTLRELHETHRIVQSNMSAKCSVCGDFFGWYCPDSLDGICEYNYDSHNESCIHCGDPEERK